VDEVSKRQAKFILSIPPRATLSQVIRLLPQGARVKGEENWRNLFYERGYGVELKGNLVGKAWFANHNKPNPHNDTSISFNSSDPLNYIILEQSKKSLLNCSFDNYVRYLVQVFGYTNVKKPKNDFKSARWVIKSSQGVKIVEVVEGSDQNNETTYVLMLSFPYSKYYFEEG